MLLPDASLLTDIPYGATIQSMLLKTICTKGEKKGNASMCVHSSVCVCASCSIHNVLIPLQLWSMEQEARLLPVV